MPEVAKKQDKPEGDELHITPQENFVSDKTVRYHEDVLDELSKTDRLDGVHHEKSWEQELKDGGFWDEDIDDINNFAAINTKVKKSNVNKRLLFNLENKLPDSEEIEWLNDIENLTKREFPIYKSDKEHRKIRAECLFFLENLALNKLLYYNIDDKRIYYRNINKADSTYKELVLLDENETLDLISREFSAKSGLNISNAILYECVFSVAVCYKISKIKQFFNYCHRQWLDKKPEMRHTLDDLISFWGEIEEKEIASHYLTKAVLTMVARGYLDEKINFPYMVIFAGNQGIGKSNNLEKLFGDFMNDRDPFGKKEDVLQDMEGYLVAPPR